MNSRIEGNHAERGGGIALIPPSVGEASVDGSSSTVFGNSAAYGGGVWGTVLGALIIGVLDNGLVLLDVSAFWQMVVKGIVILGAVALDAGRREDG